MNFANNVKYLTDEDAAEQASLLTHRKSLDLGSATLHFGIDAGSNGKMIVMTSSGVCVSVDYPFASESVLS